MTNLEDNVVFHLINQIIFVTLKSVQTLLLKRSKFIHIYFCIH